MNLYWSFLGMVFATLLAGVYGYIINIVQLFGSSEITGLVLLRLAGAVMPPLGAILGYF